MNIKVQVLMSTYNGEKYIAEQVDSIFNQSDIDIYLLVRDDGSTDDTITNLELIKKKYKNKIDIICGENIGYRKSFLKLIEYADNNMDYYAFSDQDDVWKKNKIIDAVRLLKVSDSVLYASSLDIVNEQLKKIYVKDISNISHTFESFFVRTRLAGCTMVFNEFILKKARYFSNLEYENTTMPDHDCLLCVLSLLHGYEIVLDSKSNILHRRHSDSETGGGKGFFDRISIEYKRIFDRKNSYYVLAMILRHYTELDATKFFNKSIINFLNKIEHYKDSPIAFFKLLFDKNLSCGNFLADILIRLKIILFRY